MKISCVKFTGASEVFDGLPLIKEAVFQREDLPFTLGDCSYSLNPAEVLIDLIEDLIEEVEDDDEERGMRP